MITTNKNTQHGFTIVELMIATVVFGVILLIATAALLGVGKVYYKGLNSISTQDTVRGMMDDLSQAIQFNGANLKGPVPTPADQYNKVYCFTVGSKQYYYTQYKQLEGSVTDANDQTNPGFVSVDKRAACAANPTFPGPPYHELLNQHMRIAKFDISKNSATEDLYTITIRVVFGDPDLLCSPSQGNCNNTTATDFTANPTDLTCKLGAGSQFCAVSELSTVVQKRI